jgi:alpha-D-xyloside xylohydrolase
VSAPLHFLLRPASQHFFKFDKPNANLFLIYADAMIAELHTLGIELMVSIFPNYQRILEADHLIRTDRGMRVAMDFMGQTVHFDPTNPSARHYLSSLAKLNYYDKGVKVFWLDEAEPEYSVYDFDNYRYYARRPPT